MAPAHARLFVTLLTVLPSFACSSSSNKTAADASSSNALVDAGLDVAADAGDGSPGCSFPTCMTSPGACTCTSDGGISCPAGLVSMYDGGSSYCGASADLCCPLADYCLESTIGANTGVGCAPLPAACVSTRTCACFTAQMASDPNFASCQCSDTDGVVFVTCPPSRN